MQPLSAIVAIAILQFFISPIALAQTAPSTLPEQTQDGWKISSPAAENIDPAPLATMLERIRKGDFKHLQSVLIVKNGKLVVEEYFPRTEGDRREQAFRRVSPRELTSATKSVTSLLIGIAIDQHLIRGVDEKISTLFPEYGALFADPARAKLTLRDLLTMTAGLSWDEWSRPYTDPLNDHVRMLRSDDPIRFVLEQKMLAAPGDTFTYSSGISITLGQILFKATGMRADKFADRFLFTPLGITDFYWGKYPDEIVQTGGGLYLRPRDMAKLGQLVLNKGRWQEKQIVSANWIAESTKSHVKPDLIPAAARSAGYGFQWWIDSFQLGDRAILGSSARGRGGQFISIFPELQLVVVFTSAPDNPNLFQPLDLLKESILPAASARTPATQNK